MDLGVAELGVSASRWHNNSYPAASINPGFTISLVLIGRTHFNDSEQPPSSARDYASACIQGDNMMTPGEDAYHRLLYIFPSLIMCLHPGDWQETKSMIRFHLS